MARVASVSSGSDRGAMQAAVQEHCWVQSGPLNGWIDKMADSHCAGHPKEGLRVDGINDLFCVFKTTAPNQYNVNWISIGKQQSTGASQRAWKTVKTSFELVRSDIGGALQVRIGTMNHTDLPFLT